MNFEEIYDNPEYYLELETLEGISFDLYEALDAIKYLIGETATPEDKDKYLTPAFKKEVEAVAEACWIFLRDIEEPFKLANFVFPPDPNSPLINL